MRSLAFYTASRGVSELGYQMAAVAVGWQIYALSHSALNLGLAGLVQFLPTLVLALGAGHVADRYDRRHIVAFCQFLAACTAALVAWATYESRVTVTGLFCAVAVVGVATAFESPASSALLPGVVPTTQLQRATAVSSAVFQVANIGGPAVGGVVYALSPAAPYACMAVCWLAGGILVRLVQRMPAAPTHSATSDTDESLRGLFAGVTFVKRNPTILGAISLDLVAVLLGGASALLPIYAKDILHTGPWGLGVLRTAPAIGALLMTGVLARYTLQERVGERLFTAVIIYGCCTLVFALSHSFWLSLLALALMGAADTVSVVIRISLVQLATPDEMRGRVGAVNYLFVNASNQLGEFESGITAALLGPVLAAALGGIGTIAVALLWMRLFPTLRQLQRFGH